MVMKIKMIKIVIMLYEDNIVIVKFQLINLEVKFSEKNVLLKWKWKFQFEM